MPLASTGENISNKPPCNFYMQGKCKNGKRGTNCSFPDPNMCFFRFIRQGKKGCNKGASCQYAHPKLCHASLTSKTCDRHNCYYYHVAGTLRPLTDVVAPKNKLVQDLPLLCRWRSLPHQTLYLLRIDNFFNSRAYRF